LYLVGGFGTATALGGSVRRVRYQVACSLDGYIAGPRGEFDWIVMDPEIDFEAQFAQFDTLLMGRRTSRLWKEGSLRPGSIAALRGHCRRRRVRGSGSCG
jgi:hypothetical protein